ncbi:MFS transporter [Herbaspirillum robiniae]|uniref:Putative tartrate transporter n=1 Tax=Herbaspirillum robiniae TaxID=2014887 RepID=A0A246WMZ9_9BURK|nr:MFS transporter [Herbaspirillum robiniae]NUU02433.1 MFS transporter [Herbaspirillum robiniae]OWY27674.1 MFS transporter [Herbaspirillum robiniae]
MQPQTTFQAAGTAPAAAADGFADSVFRRAAWRFIPLLFVSYVVAYLDRVNIGFAKLQMLSDLQFSDAVYGLGAGLFFLGYFIFEVPSNLLLHKLGARRWIARIMISWGLLSALTAWVDTPAAFYVIRFLLGVAEAGFFPGVILYLTYWFPAHRRGRMTAMFMAGNPVSGIVGAPLSGYIMHAFGGTMGMSGWQWLFVLEAIPAVLLSVVIYFYLDDRVADAAWLSAEEKKVIEGEVAQDARARTHNSAASAMLSGRVWLMCLILFGVIMGSYAIGFWLPSIIRGAGIADPLSIGLLAMIPYTAALIAMLLTGRSADHFRERRWHVAVPALVAACGFCLCAMSENQIVPALAGLSLGAMGVVTAVSMFWALPTSFLGGAAAAAGIALINCTGNLAGFVSPSVIGWLKMQTGSVSSGLFLVAAMLSLSALLVLLCVPARLVNR